MPFGNLITLMDYSTKFLGLLGFEFLSSLDITFFTLLDQFCLLVTQCFKCNEVGAFFC
jgi:hypothetical protein